VAEGVRRFDAIVLAGGEARRLGGADKPALLVGASTLLDHVLTATRDADRTVVVGPRRATCRPVTWCREEPVGGGPVAALAAGLGEVTAELVVVLASDLPFLTEEVVDLLVQAVSTRDGALLVDDDGRDQLLAGAWRTTALRAALPAVTQGARLGSVLAGLDAVRLSPDVGPGRPAPWFDCDTEVDLERARGIG
jgi:molybdopterin-guanine dinucleotide biosynthesis protein A